MAEIDVIDELGVGGPAAMTPVQRDAAALVNDARQIAEMVRYHLQAIRERAGRHGMTALRAELALTQREAVEAAIAQGRALLAAIAKDHDPGVPPDDPDPPAEPEDESA